MYHGLITLILTGVHISVTPDPKNLLWQHKHSLPNQSSWSLSHPFSFSPSDETPQVRNHSIVAPACKLLPSSHSRDIFCSLHTVSLISANGYPSTFGHNTRVMHLRLRTALCIWNSLLTILTLYIYSLPHHSVPSAHYLFLFLHNSPWKSSVYTSWSLFYRRSLWLYLPYTLFLYILPTLQFTIYSFSYTTHRGSHQ